MDKSMEIQSLLDKLAHSNPDNGAIAMKARGSVRNFERSDIVAG
jgi:hypothetical protein